MKEKWYEKELDKRRVLFDVKHLKAMYEIRLLSKIISLFEYHSLDVPQHELEFRAVIAGVAGVVNDAKGGLTAVWAGLSGVTKYTDVFTRITYNAPKLKGGTVSIGKDAVLLKNTSLSMGMNAWIERFAELYTHIDISLRMSLVNSRYQDVLKTTNPALKETIEEWYKGLYDGKLLAIIDDSPLSELIGDDGSISALDISTKNNCNFLSFIELENELTRTFYRDLGIRWNKDKKANLVSGEVEQDNMLLEFNIVDMLKCRQDFIKEYNKVFGKSASVELRIKLEEQNDDREIS